MNAKAAAAIGLCLAVAAVVLWRARGLGKQAPGAVRYPVMAILAWESAVGALRCVLFGAYMAGLPMEGWATPEKLDAAWWGGPACLLVACGAWGALLSLTSQSEGGWWERVWEQP